MKKRCFLLLFFCGFFAYCSAASTLDLNKILQASGVLIIKVDTVTIVDSTNVITLDNIMFENFKSRIVDTTDYKASVARLTGQIEGLQLQLSEENGKKSSLMKIFPFLLLGLVFILFVLFFVDRAKRKDRLKEEVVRIVLESKRLKSWRDDSEAKPRVQSTVQNVKTYDREINDLLRRIGALEDKNQKEEQSYRKTEIPISQPIPTKNNMMLYGDFINDGCFSRVKENPDDDTNFELHLINERTASFIIYRPACPRIISNPMAFLQGCEKQVLGNTIVSIVKEGTAMKDDNGKWRISDELKVEIR
ncbi:MAG: hypothetical protein J6P83_07350 [Bacteroidales bacterium]|nr:hypothetical protein [Bacteroidales bacterium]